LSRLAVCLPDLRQGKCRLPVAEANRLPAPQRPTIPRKTAEVNTPNAERVMATAIRRVLSVYPPPGPRDAEARVAIQGPRGLSALRYDRLARGVGMGALPLTPETEGLPRYAVKELRIRGGRAEVDVFRPVYRTLGKTEWQMITVELEGGLRPWSVKRLHERAVGAFEPPLPYYRPLEVEESEPAPTAEEITDG